MRSLTFRLCAGRRIDARVKAPPYVYRTALAGWTYLIAWGALRALGVGSARNTGAVIAVVFGALVIADVEWTDPVHRENRVTPRRRAGLAPVGEHPLGRAIREGGDRQRRVRADGSREHRSVRDRESRVAEQLAVLVNHAVLR